MKKLTQIFLCVMLVSTAFAQDFSSTISLDNPVINQTLQSDSSNSEFAPVTITQSNTQNFTQGGACNDGTFLLDTKIARAFDLENDHAVNGNFTISSVEFGVFFFGGTGPYDVVINLYSTPDPFPGGALTLQATSTRTVTSADNLTLLSEPMSAVIPAGELLVYEIDLVADGVNFPSILGNSDGGIAPTYIESVDCGFPTYGTWPSAFGTVMNVVGEVLGDPPMITCPMDVTTTASPGICGAVVGFAPPLVVDPDGDLDTVEQTMGLPSGSEFPVGVNVIEFTATDMEGAASTCSFTITVTDDEAPMAVCADISVTLDSNGEYVLNATEIDGGSTDNCGIASVDIGGNASITLTCAELGDNTITLTVTDDSGNTSTCDAIVTVVDDEAPVIICEGDFQSMDIMLNGGFETGDLSDWTAVDNPNPFIPWGAYASNDGNGFFDPALPTEGAWLAGNGFDGESGEAVLYQDVTIDPAAVGATLTWDENIDYDLASFCAGCQDRIYEVQVRDLSDNVLEVLVQITATAGIIDNDNLWVSQSADLSAYAGQDIRIAYWQQIPEDFTGPSKFALDNVQLNVETLASAPFMVELDANGNATINASDLVTVTDNCGATATVPGDPVCEEISNPGNAFENGYFSDPGSGFLVANDIVVPADEDFNLEQVTMNLFHDVGATIATADFTYYDNNAGVPGAVIGSETGVAPTSQTVVGNNFGFDVSETVFDITPFLFAGQAGVQTNYWVSVSVTSTSGGITAWEVSSASGAGDFDCLNTADGGATWGNPVPGNDGVYIFSGNCTPGADTTIDFDCSNLGINVIEVTVTDASGNSSTCNATVEVLDVTDPVLICQDVTIEIGPDGTTEIDPEDLLATAPSTFDAMVIGSDNQSGTEGFTDFTVDVTADVTVNFDWDYTLNDVPGFDSFGYIVNGAYTQLTDPAQGNQSGSASVSLVAGDVFGFRSQTDDNGFGNNETMVTNFDPGFDGQFDPANWELTLTNSDGDAFFIEIPGGPLSFDACGITVLAVDVTEVTCADVGTVITATVFASDASGNIASCTSQITVVDALAPELTCPADQSVDPGPGNLFYEIPDYFATGEATAEDNCTDPVTITTQDPAAGSLVPDGVYTITLTAEDEYGNVSTCTFELTVESVLGLEDTVLDNAISLYPNPASSVVTLANTASILLEQAAIYDTNGRLIRTIDLADMQQEMAIDVSDLATGVYMVMITSEDASTVKRLVKE